MTVPADPHRTTADEDIGLGAFTPHSANEGGDSREWLQEVLPVGAPDAGADPGPHRREDHLPHGWHDFGALGWVAVLLMAVVVALVVWGLVLPWLGLTHAWAVDPLR